MLAVQLVLVCWLVVAGMSLLVPSPGIAVVLAALSALWLPVNNGHLEGPVLFTVDSDRGMTTADLLSVGGFALALLAGWRWRRSRLRQPGRGGRALSPAAMAAFVAVLVVLLGCGLAASWVHNHGAG